ncbi:MAG: type II toxin-antitoxin system CcdA family antitoxin [Desulfuromonadales bacterium]|nr:type II toxin-antitoxin system CcdA family antitoxin [Desulfuromonadales bacterium]
MRLSYNTQAPKRPVNLTANSDLVNRVRNEKGNLSALFEQSMITFLAEKELARWKEENKAAFASYNRMIEERGTLSEDIGLLL